MSFGKSNKKQTTNQNSQTEPWAPTIPYLKDFLSNLGGMPRTVGPTADQSAAYASLKDKAATGDTYASETDQLAKDLFGATSRSGTVDEAYTRLQSQLGGVASGANQDILSDPRIAAMLQTVGNDVQNRIAGVFAGSGRDIAGNAAGQGAIGKGVTAAQLPILINEFARQQGRTDDAIKTLFGGGTTAATTAQGLDKDALATRAGGITAAQAALTARDLPENTILNLDQQLKNLPFEDLSLYLSLLLPTAGLGGQQTGTSTTKQKGTTFGLSL